MNLSFKNIRVYCQDSQIVLQILRISPSIALQEESLQYFDTQPPILAHG